MHDRVELAALRLVREHDRAELRAVERAVGLQHVRAERRDDLRERGRARLHDLPREDVGVDDGEAVFPQEV